MPESKPLPVGSGGGASFWRIGFAGGVGAFELAGVPLAVGLAFTAVATIAFVASESISIGEAPVGTAV